MRLCAPPPILTSAERDATLVRLLEPLKADQRTEAAVINGSLGGKTADRLSDIDVATVVLESESADAVADDWIERMYREFPVAHHYRTQFGTTIVPGFLLTNGPEVDLAFTPAAEFAVWGPTRRAASHDRTGRRWRLRPGGRGPNRR
jgi:hypothetical protein